MYEIVGKIAGVISLVAFVPYIVAILRGKTKPNRATWWIWTIVGIMLGASYYFSGANNTLWVPISYIIGPLAIAILSIKYGEGGWNRFDRYCLLGAMTSAILWWLFDSPFIALLINLFIDFLGALPTIKKVYKKPETEDRTAWVLFFLGNVVNLFAIETWVFTIAVYPVYMFCGNGIITTLVLLRRRKA